MGLNFRDKRRDNIITCPVCGREYLPAEIFLPSVFFGKPVDIDRDSTGRIEAYDGTTMNTEEDYVCDNCGATFTVEAAVKFKTKERKIIDFNPVYTSSIKSRKILLSENLEEVSGSSDVIS